MHTSEIDNTTLDLQANLDHVLWTPDFTSQVREGGFLDDDHGQQLVSGQDLVLTYRSMPTKGYGLPSLDYDIEPQPMLDSAVGAQAFQANIRAQPGDVAVNGQSKMEVKLGSNAELVVNGIVDVDSSAASEPDGSLLGDDNGTSKEITTATTSNSPSKDSESDEEDGIANAICDTGFGLVSLELDSRNVRWLLTRKCSGYADLSRFSSLLRISISATNSLKTRREKQFC